MDSKELSSMLMESARVVYAIIKEPSKKDLETKKLIIAGANTLAQTAKTMIQTEIIGMKLNVSKENVNLLVNHVINGKQY